MRNRKKTPSKKTPSKKNDNSFPPPHLPPPKKTLVAHVISMMRMHLSLLEKVAVALFLALMMVIPLLLNSLKVQMIQGSSTDSTDSTDSTGSKQVLGFYVLLSFISSLISWNREKILLRIATKLQNIFNQMEIERFTLLSMKSRNENPAYITMKSMRDASWSINRVVDWGLCATGSMVGKSISSLILLVLYDLDWVDKIILPIGIVVAYIIIRKLQLKLTEMREKIQIIDEEIDSLMPLNCEELQKGEMLPKDFFEFINKSIKKQNMQISPIYNNIGYVLDIVFGIIKLIYAYALLNNREVLAKFILLETIMDASSSLTNYGSQYLSFQNEYDKYCRMFYNDNKTPLEYSVSHEQLKIPDEGLKITRVYIKRGSTVIMCAKPFHLRKGGCYLVTGPTGIGKTSLMQSLQGLIPGMILSSEVPGNYTSEILMHSQDCASSVLCSVSLEKFFETKNPRDFDTIKSLMRIVFGASELKKFLDNISKSSPFTTLMNEKMSGGQRRMLYIVRTLYKQHKQNQSMIIFDEIEAGLDAGNRCEVFRNVNDYLNKKRVTRIFISHMCECNFEVANIAFDGELSLCPSSTGCKIVFKKKEQIIM